MLDSGISVADLTLCLVNSQYGIPTPLPVLKSRFTSDALDEPCGEWWFGPSASGKTTTQQRLYPNAFPLGFDMNWNNYNNEEVVVFSDVSHFSLKRLGWDLALWGGKDAFKVAIQNKEIIIRPKRFILITWFSMEDVFGSDSSLMEALRKQFRVVNFHSVQQSNE